MVAGLDALCGRAGLILHRTAREVARTCSLRAVQLTLKLHAQEQAASLAATARAAYLASATKWDKKAATQFNAFLARLDSIATGPQPPRRVTRAELIQLFQGLGIPERKLTHGPS